MTMIGSLTGSSRGGVSGLSRASRIPADMRPTHDVAMSIGLLEMRSLPYLADNPDRHIRRLAAEHPLCQPEVLDQLSDDIDAIVVITVARHPNCSPQLLAKLSAHLAWQVRYEVARHPGCPGDYLLALLNDPNKGVRQRCASRRPMPAWLLELALAHSDPVVRYMAAVEEPW